MKKQEKKIEIKILPKKDDSGKDKKEFKKETEDTRKNKRDNRQRNNFIGEEPTNFNRLALEKIIPTLQSSGAPSQATRLRRIMVPGEEKQEQAISYESNNSERTATPGEAYRPQDRYASSGGSYTSPDTEQSISPTIKLTREPPFSRQNRAPYPGMNAGMEANQAQGFNPAKDYDADIEKKREEDRKRMW